MGRRVSICAAVAVALVASAAAVAVSPRGDMDLPGASLGRLIPTFSSALPVTRDRGPYAGYGAWIDGFDLGNAYQHGTAPPLSATVVDDLAAHGVRTLYLQAVRDDTRSPDGFVDGGTIADLLIRAHRAGLKVVAWYLPRFRDVSKEVADVEKMASFEVLGHRFDGIAIDIEYTTDAPEVTVRNQRLVEFSRILRERLGSQSIGAIVLPPVQTEVINPEYWPDFPWTQLRDLYDVWLPMSYWTFRTGTYADGFSYNEESVRRLRNDLGKPDAAVHAIGGIGDKTTVEQIGAFARSLSASASVGGSIYDWNSMTPTLRDRASEVLLPLWR